MSIQSIWEFLPDPYSKPVENRGIKKPVRRPRYEIVAISPEGEIYRYSSIQKAALHNGISKNFLRERIQESGMNFIYHEDTLFGYCPLE